MVQRHTTDKTFDDFYLSPELRQALEAIGYVRPTPVQVASIPLTMAGIDLIVQSQTGTGKTAAFGIPVVEMLEPDPGTIEVLVLAPTRELAKQVSEEFTRLTQYRPIASTAIYGGTAYAPQLEALKTAQIVCATPGRLLDLLKQKELSLKSLRFFILDEADEMLSMGFERDLRAVLEYLPEERQSLLFSATVTRDVRALAQHMLFYPEYLSFSSDSVVNRDVHHSYFSVSGLSRTRDLVRIIEFEQPDNAIVFANTKDDTFLVNNYLQRHGYASEVLNGDLAQKDRERTLAKLRDGEIDFLVATDVAARGIDISELSHVFNYVLSESPEVYVHRTGRTGRAGKKGRAVSLVSPAEMAALILTSKRVDMEIERRALPTTKELIEVRRARRAQSVLDRVEAFAASDAVALESYLEHAASLRSLEDATRHIAALLALADEALDEHGALRRRAAPAQPARSAATPERHQEEEKERAPQRSVDQEQPEPKRDERQEQNDRRRRDEEPSKQKAQQAPAQDAEEQEVEEQVAEETLERAPRPKRERRSRRAPRPSRRGPPEPEKGEEEELAAAPEARRERSTSSSTRPAARPASSVARRVDREMSRLWLSFGKDVFGDPQQVLDFLTYNSGMDEEDFGEVRIERAHTFVDVRRDYLHDVIAAIDTIEHDGETLSAKQARRS